MGAKNIISFFTFGVFLIIVGVILKILKWPQANLILLIGLIFELLAILFYIWEKLKK
ncbi:GldL-related protein [Lutibacter sp.]